MSRHHHHTHHVRQLEPVFEPVLRAVQRAWAHPQPVWFLYALIAVNGIAFAAFGMDKRAARAGRWRIAEGTLLGWALLGGTAGAYAGRAAFRHKTRKQPFCAQLHTIAVLQVVAVCAAGWWWFKP